MERSPSEANSHSTSQHNYRHYYDYFCCLVHPSFQLIPGCQGGSPLSIKCANLYSFVLILHRRLVLPSGLITLKFSE
jgi:hypothetical protein